MFKHKYQLNNEAGDAGSTGGAPPPAAEPQNWRDSLPPDLKDAPTLQDIPDINALAKRFIDTKAMVGNSMRLPTEDAGADDIQAAVDKILGNEKLGLMRKPDPEDIDGLNSIYNSLGRPEDISGYQAPEGVDANAFGAMAEKAHELGLTKAQYENLSQAHAALVKGEVDAAITERNTGLQQLQGEWGLAYDEKVHRAADLVKLTKGPEDLMTAVTEGNVNAATLRWLDSLATQMGQEGTNLAQQIGGVHQQTPDELRQRANEIGKRLINEDMTQQQRTDLINKRLKLFEQLEAFA